MNNSLGSLPPASVQRTATKNRLLVGARQLLFEATEEYEITAVPLWNIRSIIICDIFILVLHSECEQNATRPVPNEVRIL
jgi:hypothetical protein